MTAPDELVARLADAAGIAEGYADSFGRWVHSSPETRRALLPALGLDIGSAEAAEASLARVERLRRGLLPAVPIVEAGRTGSVPLRLHFGSDALVWRLTTEGGRTREGRATLAPDPDGTARLDLPALPAGYHRLEVEAGSARAAATLIAAPARCYLPPEIAEADAAGGRLWGLAAQLYGLRSDRNFGIGDFQDVGEAAACGGGFGASFLGLSPIHALFAADRSKVSPYSPSSRLFIEPLYLDVTAIKGAMDGDAARLLAEPEFQAALQEMRAAPLVDYGAVWQLKRRLLDALWPHVRTRAHAGFGRTHREALKAHAAFEALSEHFWSEGRHWLGEWPEAYRDPHSPEVARFVAEHADRVAFHAWLQYELDRQLAGAAERAARAGMGIGLYRDLAVGADRGGSEVWSNPERFAASVSIGAPPDPLGPHGQNWGLPSFNPLVLEEQGLAAFRALVSANMRHAGAIRIDHAFQLRRLFLIPEGAPAREGSYVAFPFEAMLAVLRVESHKARALVIAEDLGTGPEGFSEAIMASGVLSYRVLFFEHEPDGAFKRPGAYPRCALAVLTTHDLPTFRGWWRGLDIDLRETLGVYDAVHCEHERRMRAEDRARLAAVLAGEGLLGLAEPPEEPPLEAAVRYLARTPSALAGVQLEDAAGELAQANLPGVAEGVPNWRRKLSLDLGALFAPAGELSRLAAGFAAEGRSREPRPSPLSAPPPRATYRLQFHKDFTFDDAAAVAPYLARLGVSHVYASPILQARPGSMHGYDIVNHQEINPELGGEAGFERLVGALKAHGLGLILDIVPNHMGVGGADNGWWLSALEWGELSPVSRYFDIDWGRLGAGGKIIVPFLGDRYGDALEKGDLKLDFDPQEGSFSVWHYEHRLPVSPLQYPMILERAAVAVPDPEAESVREALAVSEQLRAMGEETAPERRAAFPEETEALKRRLAAAASASPELVEGIRHAVQLINGTPGVPDSFGTLHRILEAQAYRLAYWRVAASDINYRRFFDVNSLAGLRMEEPELFEAAHAAIFRLARAGHIQGLRIDHIDGLAEPEAYLQALQAALGPGFYVVVEKILEPGEGLCPSWPVAGTTGYDALNVDDGIFVAAANEARFERLYRDFSGLEGRYASLLREAKTEILVNSFSSELEVLVSDLKRIADADRRTRDYTTFAIRQALVEIVSLFPVYRTYIGESGPSRADRSIVDETVARAKQRSRLPDRSVHDFIAAALLGEIETDAPGRPEPELVARFRRRFQQLTGPVTAKSLEDTLFYRYVRLLSLCEVGGDPARFGISVDAFHEANAARRAEWPHALVASATHDTKRGEDARLRLNALSELPDEWAQALESWREIAAPLLTRIDGEPAPDANDQYLILQSLLGAWPLELLDPAPDRQAAAQFRERMDGYVVKALREAKRHTSWVHIRQPYEQAALALLAGLLDPDGAFLGAFRPLAERLIRLGLIASLARTTLKCTVPGVPDIYQGTEFWDFSLVDPDNRRPVDYAARARGLGESEAPEASWDDLLASWPDGRVKQRLLARLLAHRAAEPELYAQGSYAPLDISGPKAGDLAAFARSHAGRQLLVIVPRRLAGALGDGLLPAPGAWEGTAVLVPAGRYVDLLSGAGFEADGRAARLAAPELFARSPIAVLASGAKQTSRVFAP